MRLSKTEIAGFLETIIDSMPQNEHFYHMRKSFACLPKEVICILIESGCETFENVLATTEQAFLSSKEGEIDFWRIFCDFMGKYNKLQKKLKIKSIANTAFILAQALCRPVKEAQQGPVYCESINIYFPTLYRATVVTTINHLKEAGAYSDPEFKPGTWFAFNLTMQNNRQYVGDVTWDTVSCIRPNEQDESIVIRFHKSYESASAYLRGYIDTDNDYFFSDMCGLYKTVQGCFTYINIQSKAEWNGPLVFYLAEIPTRLLNGHLL